jgi:hypothetical protein
VKLEAMHESIDRIKNNFEKNFIQPLANIMESPASEDVHSVV